MGRTLENKKGIVAELQELLKDAQLAMVIDFKGLSVSEISDSAQSPAGKRRNLQSD
jgi:large subunit ribosomal protein L10